MSRKLKLNQDTVRALRLMIVVGVLPTLWVLINTNFYAGMVYLILGGVIVLLILMERLGVV